MNGRARDVDVGNDRQRQLAAAAWILGFVGGPVPAALILLVGSRDGWSRTFARAAAVYWLIAWALFWISVTVVASWNATAGSVAAIGTVVVSLAATSIAAARATRRSADEQRRTR